VSSAWSDASSVPFGPDQVTGEAIVLIILILIVLFFVRRRWFVDFVILSRPFRVEIVGVSQIPGLRTWL